MTGLDEKCEWSQTIALRREVVPADRERVRALVRATGFFSPSEVDVAVELVDERLTKGAGSGYHFVFAETGGECVGYACYGPIPATAVSYDLYWIVVHKNRQRRGLGQLLLDAAERRIRAAGGRRVYVDTSNRAQYEPTRAFYESRGYRREAVLPDFYAPGDDKVIYVKVLD
jgi:ribosomal protein S18 acetylase RimI-like enzyme